METLKKNYEFRRLYSKGKSAVTRSLVVYFRGTSAGKSRVGFTVSNKIGNAVTRNRIRRRLREILRAHEDRMRDSVELVIVARTRAAFSDYHQLEADFLKACEELSLFRKGE